MELTIQIVGENLAEIDFGESRGEGRARFFLGIQKGQEVVDCVPATTDTATFTATFAVSPLPDGAPNFLGPYAHGTRADRFCYLVWLHEGEDGQKSRFARIKLPLKSLQWADVETASRAETPLVLRFSLLGKNGGPVCASIAGDAIRWKR